jgi:hypothetical protein
VRHSGSLRGLELTTLSFEHCQGLLAIWNDVVPGRESDFERWYQSEHLPERLAVPGFRLGRRWEALTGRPQHFCCYLVDEPDVLSSAAYMDRLNNPTPWTRRVMSEAFQNMTRSACSLVASEGSARGAICVVARFSEAMNETALTAAIGKWGMVAGIARCELWRAVPTDVAEEERLRGGDTRIAGCVLVETLRLQEAELACCELAGAEGIDGVPGIYQLLCARVHAVT